EHAGELADASVRDGEGRAVMADRDCDEGGVTAVVRLLERPKERERLEVDANEADAGLTARADVAVDEVAIGDHEEDALDRPALGVDRRLEHAVVEDGLVEWDRQRLLRTELDGVPQLLVVVDADDVEDAHADAVRRDAETNVLPRELVPREERLQCVGERVGLAQLSRDDDALRERLACDLQKLGGAVVRNARGCELRRADLEPDVALRAVAAGAAAAARERRQREREVALQERRLRRSGDGQHLRRRVRLDRGLRGALERELLLPERLPLCFRLLGGLRRLRRLRA